MLSCRVCLLSLTNSCSMSSPTEDLDTVLTHLSAIDHLRHSAPSGSRAISTSALPLTHHNPCPEHRLSDHGPPAPANTVHIVTIGKPCPLKKMATTKTKACCLRTTILTSTLSTTAILNGTSGRKTQRRSVRQEPSQCPSCFLRRQARRSR